MDDLKKLPQNAPNEPSLIVKIVAVILTLAYVGSPVDVIPDFIPILGQVDDITAIYLCYRFICLGGK